METELSLADATARRDARRTTPPTAEPAAGAGDRDGGITWRTSWEVTNEQRRALARHYDYLGDLVRSCRRWRWPVGGDQDTRNRPD